MQNTAVTALEREYSILHHVRHTLVFNKFATVSFIVPEWSLFFIRPRVIYCWDILLSQHMLDVAKCIVDDNFVFQQDSAPVLASHTSKVFGGHRVYNISQCRQMRTEPK